MSHKITRIWLENVQAEFEYLEDLAETDWENVGYGWGSQASAWISDYGYILLDLAEDKIKQDEKKLMEKIDDD